MDYALQLEVGELTPPLMWGFFNRRDLGNLPALPSYNLMRPISYFGYHYAANLSGMIINFILSLIIALLVVALMEGFNISLLAGIALSLPLIFLAVTLNFLVLFNIGLLACRFMLLLY